MYCYILLYIVMYCYILLCIVKYCYVLLCIVMYCYLLLSIVKYCYVLLSIVMYCYVLLSIVMYCYVLLCQYKSSLNISTIRLFFKMWRKNSFYKTQSNTNWEHDWWCHRRSQWPRSLRRGSAAARLQGLRVRIPQCAWLSVVIVVCCQTEAFASGWSLF
jgi:hypothetical protein